MSLLNRAAVKRLAKELSIKHRNGKFTLVSASFVNRIEAQVNNLVESEVRKHPTVGKTLQ